ncbi:hypothetical protein EBB07_06600 [Paenibacillaceae bacterium]|nr:hypothetical protein EBB07_06600 [Paenibacillaceae bacterium]
MAAIFAGIVGCYVLAAVAVHAVFNRSHRKDVPVCHYVLVGDSQQLQMERYIRSIYWKAQWSGIPARVTVIDEGFADETYAIVKKFSEKTDVVCHCAKELNTSSVLTNAALAGAAEQIVRIDLRVPDDLAKLPC